MYEFSYHQHQLQGPDRITYRRDLMQNIGDNAERERTRVKTLRGAFLELQRSLPAVPPDTKLSKLDVLVLATTYIAHLMRTLNDEEENQNFAANGILHPVKKWPMRSRLYAGILSSTFPVYTGRHVENRQNNDKHNTYPYLQNDM
ncbi:transcription factor 24-like [Mytilus edulis]|uniref:transcription factor 24-like n=1 Tax=Mytilus edulis TaxID=6550 RepID=UPI0039EF7193